MQELRKCVICGKEYIATKANCICCSTPCKKERNRQKARENWKRYIQEGRYHDRMKKTNIRMAKTEKRQGDTAGMSLAEVNAKAREAGMSYGQYMVKKGL